MHRLSQWVFGAVEFAQGEEFREFQYKFLLVLQLFGALATAIFLGLVLSGVAPPFSVVHLRMMGAYTTLSVLLWLVLRGHPARFLTVAWVYEAVSLLELGSAFYFVHNDELRVLWLFTNIPGCYLILGRRAGAAVTAGIVAAFIALNPHVRAPYSANAVTTGVIAMLYFGAFFHAYAKQSLYFSQRMRESNDALRELATRDPLTGLLNARAYYERSESAMQLAKRQLRPYAVLFIDLDHFKRINDTHGHAAGDVVLKAVAHGVAEQLRRSDVLGRIGGEEFCALLCDSDLEAARDKAEAIRRRIEQLAPSIAGQPLHVTASIGVVAGAFGEQTMPELQKLADQAMYRAKEQGRNRVSVLAAQEPPQPAARSLPHAGAQVA